MKRPISRTFLYYGYFYLFMCIWLGIQPTWAVQHVHLAEQHHHDGFEHQHQAVAHTPHRQNLADHASHHWARIVDIDLKYHLSKLNKHNSPSLGLFQTINFNLAGLIPLILRTGLALNLKPRLIPYRNPPARAPPLG